MKFMMLAFLAGVTVANANEARTFCYHDKNECENAATIISALTKVENGVIVNSICMYEPNPAGVCSGMNWHVKTHISTKNGSSDSKKDGYLDCGKALDACSGAI